MSRNFELLQGEGTQELLSELFAPAATEEGAREIRGESTIRHSPEIVKLVHALFLSGRPNAQRKVLFCGFEEADASGELCVRAAEVLARAVTAPVGVVDAKILSPSLHRYFSLDGPSAWMDDELSSGLFRSRQVSNNLWFIAPDSLRGLGEAAPGTEQLRSSLRELGKRFEYLLIAGESIGREADAAVLGPATDGVVLVLEAIKTRRMSAVRAKQALETAGVPLLGTVLNNRTFPIPDILYRKL